MPAYKHDTIWGDNSFVNQAFENVYTILNALSDLITGVKPLLSQTFTGEVNLSTGNEVGYKRHTFNNALIPTVSVVKKENSCARILLDAGAAATFAATNLGTPYFGSVAFTAGKLNELIVFVLPDGANGDLVVYHSIKVLN